MRETKSPVPPRGERIARAIGHSLFFVGAMYGVFGQLPESLRFAADPIQLIIWAVTMSTGIIAGYATLRGRYLLEYAMIPFMVCGLMIYAIALVYAVLDGHNPGTGLPAAITTGMMGYAAARWLSLNQLLDSPLRLVLRRRRSAESGGGHG